MGSSNGTPKRQCKATTKAGKRCKAKPQSDREVCLAHDEERRASTGFGGSENGRLGGRPRSPKAIDVLRERIERDIDKWLDPLEQGLTAERALVVGDGPHARLELTPDIPTRMKAMQLAFDRAFGKPAQAIKHSQDESEVDAEIRRLLAELDGRANGVHAANGDG